MFNNVCLYNSKLFTAIIRGRNPYLISYEYINSSKQNFREQLRLEIPLRTTLKPETVVLNTADHFVLGLKCIVILVIGYSDDANVFVYSDIIPNLIEIHYLESLLTPPNPNNNIFVTDGPLLVTFSSDVFEFYLFSKRNDKKSLKVTPKFPVICPKVLQLTCVGQISSNNSFNNVILVVLCDKTNNLQEIDIFSSEISHDSTTVNCEKLSATSFFPEFLKTQAKNVNISNLLIPSCVSKLVDIDWGINASIVCTMCECFICSNGELKYVTVLPFQNISRIVEDLKLHSLQDSSLILKSHKKDVALFKIRKSPDEIQLKKNWCNVQNILIGDILMNGSKQMLLLKVENFDDTPEDYILTDISSCVPVDILNQPTIPDEFLKSTISGLSTKLQTGKLAAVQKGHEIDEKRRAILDALNRLKVAACDTTECEISTFQDSLVNIILGNDENNKMEMDCRRDKQFLKILNHWAKFYDNNWFLCWTFQNENNSAICYPSIKITIEDYKILCCHKIYLHNKSYNFSLEHSCTKQINPKEIFSILTCVKFPTFCMNSIEVKAVLSWYSGTLKEFENEVFLPQEEKCLAQNQISLSTCLDALNVFSINQTEFSTAEELFCLKLARHKTVLKVSSKFSSLLHVDEMLLQSKLGSLFLSSVETSNSKVLMFKNKESPLFGAHFRFNFLESNIVEIEAFVTNDNGLLTLLQFLHHCLPKDILLLPCVKTFHEVSEMRRNLVCFIKEECEFLIALLNAHNIYSQIQDYSEIPAQAGTIVIPKKTFLRMRRTLVKKEFVTDIKMCDISYL